MTSYGGPTLGPESRAHGSQRGYLGQMVKSLMAQPCPLVSRKKSRMACYGDPHMCRIIHLATGGVCWPRVGPGGESQSAEVRRFAYHACFPAGGYRDSRPT